MDIAITGTRTFKNKQLLSDSIDALAPARIITSEAGGADALAIEYAKRHNIPCVVVFPKFKTDKATKYHPRYFHMRNREIVDQADMVLAFWDGQSRGTKSTMDYANKSRKPLQIIHC